MRYIVTSTRGKMPFAPLGRPRRLGARNTADLLRRRARRTFVFRSRERHFTSQGISMGKLILRGPVIFRETPR